MPAEAIFGGFVGTLRKGWGGNEGEDVARRTSRRSARGAAALAVVALVVAGLPSGAYAALPPLVDVEHPERCDPLDARACLLPFPSDHFTVADPTTDTGRRVHLDVESMPKNVNGVPINPAEFNRNDGWSPGNALLTYVPGLDIEQTGLATTQHLARSLVPNAPIVIVDAVTGERWPYFAELDAQAPSDADRLLIIRPLKNFHEGHRYVVGLRRMKDAAGNKIPAGPVFERYRDDRNTGNPTLDLRRKSMDDIFKVLHRAGVKRKGLYLAWDFTVASERNLSERMLHLRDDGFASLGGGVPAFTVGPVVDNVSSDVFRRVTGTFDVPRYLTGTGGPGTGFNWGPSGLPARNGTMQANFNCIIPRAATATGADPVQPSRAFVYGHGLLGTANEVNSLGSLANAYNIVICGTDWIGMSTSDIGNVFQILNDNSRFHTLADRGQQGMLNMLFLARLLRDPRGFATAPAFKAGASQTPVFQSGEVWFNGNSQGGIMGGAVTAVSTEWTRAVLGVPGMNYSTLLTRSVDYDPFLPIGNTAYPDGLLRTVQLSLIQLLWDRADANGYAAHMTDDPYPGTPPHDVLLFEAFGDHQVANIATNNEARTIGARVRVPALGPGRTADEDTYFLIPSVPSSPAAGSVLVVWDFGTPAPPPTNIPPRPPQFGSDPHGAGRNEPRVAQMVSDFLRPGGAFVDPCPPGLPCTTP